MKFTLTINCDNAAFQPAHDDAGEAEHVFAHGLEIERVFRAMDLADDLSKGLRSGFLRDGNGNRCGRWSLNSGDKGGEAGDKAAAIRETFASYPGWRDFDDSYDPSELLRAIAEIVGEPVK